MYTSKIHDTIKIIDKGENMSTENINSTEVELSNDQLKRIAENFENLNSRFDRYDKMLSTALGALGVHGCRFSRRSWSCEHSVLMIKILGNLPAKVYVACSGGPDSMAVLDFLVRGKREVTVAHFNHDTPFGRFAEKFLRTIVRNIALIL